MRKTVKSARHIPYLFMAPALAIYSVFLVYPMFDSLYLSFFEWDGLSAKKTFVGLNNYIEFFFDDETARKATINTFVWTLGSLVIPSSLGLILALALNRGGKVSVVLRTIFYSPAVLPLVGVGLIWGWMYNPNFGVINVILKSVGLILRLFGL